MNWLDFYRDPRSLVHWTFWRSLPAGVFPPQKSDYMTFLTLWLPNFTQKKKKKKKNVSQVWDLTLQTDGRTDEQSQIHRRFQLARVSNKDMIGYIKKRKSRKNKVSSIYLIYFTEKAN